MIEQYRCCEKKLGQTARDRGNSSNYVISGNCASNGRTKGSKRKRIKQRRIYIYVYVRACVKEVCVKMAGTADFW